MRDIKNRNDINLLVKTFYQQVLLHKELAPFFQDSIKDWDEHLEKITNFWESNLLFQSSYSGNPMQAHIQLDEKMGNTIENKHFGFWLQLWLTTVDRLFEGELANRAKNNARKMGTHLYMHIFKKQHKQS